MGILLNISQHASTVAASAAVLSDPNADALPQRA
jgi:hypothetical protein